MPDQVGTLEPERAQKLVVGEREVEEIVERLDAGRASDPGVRRRVHAERGGQEIEERRPGAPLEVRVEVDERGALTGGEHAKGDRASSNLDGAIVRHQPLTPTRCERLMATSGPCSPATDRGRGA